MKEERKDRKILHKVKKSWIIIGMTTLSFFGIGYEGIHNDIVPLILVANADESLNDKGPVTININKDDFLNYFQLMKDASYDQSTGVITLTPDAQIKTGGVSLKNKISMNRSFVLKGSIYAGDKLDSQGGADGLSIFLHPNSVNTQISTGGSAGMWGIQTLLVLKLILFIIKQTMIHYQIMIMIKLMVKLMHHLQHSHTLMLMEILSNLNLNLQYSG